MNMLDPRFQTPCNYNYNFFHRIAEVGTDNIISLAQRNEGQRSFQPVKAQRNFRCKLFHSVEAQRFSAIAERHFRTKLKRNLTSAIEISQHKVDTAFFAILDRKRVNNLRKKANSY